MLQLKDLETKQLRQFLVRKRYQQQDFYCRIQVEQNKKRLLLFRFSKKCIQQRQIRPHIEEIMAKTQIVDHSAINKTLGMLQDSKHLYVLMIDDMLVTLSQLIQKRQRLTLFQLKYFLSELYFSLYHLKSKGYFIAKLSMKSITLDSSVKINFGFPMWLSELAKSKKVRKTMKLNHIGLECSCESDDPEKIMLWEMALIFYYLLEGEPLISNSFQKKQIKEQKVRLKYTHPDSQSSCLLHKMLFNPSFKFNDLMSQPLLNTNIPKVLPQSIIFCPPSKKFQQDILKTIKLQSNPNDKKQIKRIESQEQKHNKQTIRMDDEENDEVVYIQEFCDITAKFGYGYKMSNGIIGFYFNDRTLLLLNEDTSNRQLHYFDENWVEKIYKQDKLIDQHDMKKKLYILDAFRKAVCQFKKLVAERRKIVYIKNYVKVKNAKLFLLSNNTTQAKFIDNTQILCFASNSSMCFDKKAEEFVEISPDDTVDILIRENYTKELAIKLFDWLKMTDEKEEYQ